MNVVLNLVIHFVLCPFCHGSLTKSDGNYHPIECNIKLDNNLILCVFSRIEARKSNKFINELNILLIDKLLDEIYDGTVLYVMIKAILHAYNQKL